MRLSDHAEGYFPVDRILLDILIMTLVLFFMNISAFHLARNPSQNFLVLQQQQNLGRRFGTSKIHLSPPVA